MAKTLEMPNKKNLPAKVRKSDGGNVMSYWQSSKHWNMLQIDKFHSVLLYNTLKEHTRKTR